MVIASGPDLLRYAQKRPWLRAFLHRCRSLGVDGTLESAMKNTPAAGRVMPRPDQFEHVRTMSGFADTGGGRRLMFSFMSNNEYEKIIETTDAMNWTLPGG